MCRLSPVLAFTLAAWAQGPTSILTRDPLDCFQMSDAPRAGATLQRIAAEGQPFPQALRVRTPPHSGNAWDIRIRCFSTAAVRQNDTILATFWMRTLSAGKGFTTLVVERDGTPYTKSAQWTTSAGADWKKIEAPFRMLESYPEGSVNYSVSFWVTFEPQEIEIGGISILNHGQNVPFESLGLTNWPYEGHAPDAPWRAAAAARIEEIRKADIAVIVKDDAGKPVPNAQVRVKMKRHAFGFGSAVDGSTLRDNPQYRETVLRLFNKVVIENDLKWPFWETWGRAPAEYELTWLRDNGLTDIRGHNVIWPGRDNLPRDVQDMLSGDKAALRARIYNHIAEVMAFTKGRVTEWDVLNEPYTNKDVQAVLGDEEMAVWFKKAREADPNVKLYINDYNIVEAGGYDVQHQNGYYNIIRDLIAQGAPLDGIGLQCHFNMNLTPLDRVLEILDRFAQFGTELEVTEFDLNVPSEQVQADYTRDFLTTVFSHPSVTGFLMWGFWEGKHWLPAGAMFHRDWSAKPNYDVWQDLVFKQWWTNASGATGDDGVFRTRGFLGGYDVEIGTRTLPLTVAGGRPNYVRIGAEMPGTITAAGVVNAASFRSGPVAPGEMIEIWGQGFGPAPGVDQFGYGAGGRLPTYGSEIRVLFDGVPAALVHTLAGRVSAVAPYTVSGTTRIEVEYQGTRTNAVEVPVAAAAPGIFGWGDGRPVVVNIYGDGSTAFNKDRAAAKGGYISFYITGDGRTEPAWEDGRLPTAPNFPKPAQAFRVLIGGVESRCEWNWIGLVAAGVTQVNACVPQNAPSGSAVPLVFEIGGASSQPGITVAIE